MILAPLPTNAAIGIYIHVPFCSHICPYCDFTTYAGKDALIPRYVDAVCRELERSAPSIEDREVATVFLGGGTPSLLDPSHIATILNRVRGSYRLQANAEITMECNPNGLTGDRLAGYRKSGVNRLSIGAQTLDRKGLRRLGRQHEATDVLTALDAAHDAGFENVSLDFIFGWPGQELASWQRDLDAVLNRSRSPAHLSLYSLIVEPGTPFGDAAARGILQMPDDDASADMYEHAINRLSEAGWTHYEVANWSREPDGHSRHNAIYWQHGDFLGIGAGAHGTVGNRRTMNHLLPETYIAALADDGPAYGNVETIDSATSMAETMLLGLRLLNAGVNKDGFAHRHGVTLDEVYGTQIADLTAIGMLDVTEDRVRLTHRGLLLANDVISRFL